MTTVRTMTLAINTPDAAATRTSNLDSIIPHMRIGSMSVRAFERNRDTGTLSIEAMNDRNAPAAMPGAMRGSVILRNVVNRRAPRLAELSSSDGSSWVKLANVVRNTNGAIPRRGR